MKKSLFFVAALALTFVACEPKDDVDNKTIGTFEEAAISPAAAESAFTYATDTVAFLQSGNFQIQQTVAYGGTYVTGGVVTNITSTDFNDYTDAYKSAAGGAYAGKNYVVWYEDGFTPNVVKLNHAAVVPGMYVNNTAWVVDAILNGDGMSDDGGKPFDETDFFTLTISGTLEGVPVNTEILVDLAYNGKYIKDWTYVSLKKLGKIDALAFKLSGSKQNSYGLTTPAYFAIDDLGARK